MKRIIKSVVVGAIFIAASVTNANAQKTGHINLDSLHRLMPEHKKAEQDMQDYAKQLEQQISAMRAELQDKYAKYQAESKDLPEIVRTAKEKELNDLNQRIQDFEQQAQVEYQKKSAELAKPLFDKAKKAIEQVAKENGYKYILDTSSGIVIYSEATEDILPLVIKKLGITPGAVAPAATPAPVVPKKQ
jgi:outer membrane protein